MIMRKVRSFINRLVNKILMTTDWYREGFWKGTTKFWNISTCDYEIVNLGSNSGKYAFSYDNIHVKGMNWAIGPQSLVHDFNLLKNYFSYLREGGIVLIPLCPFSCLYSPYTKQSNFKYYPILHPATIIDFDETERTKAYKIKANPFKEMPMYCIKSTIKELLLKLYKRIKVQRSIDFEQDAKNWIALWKNQFKITDLNAPMSMHHKIERTNRAKTLKAIINFCQERKLRPFIVLPPLHPSLSSCFSPEFRKEYIYDFIMEATNDRSLLLDYLEDKTLCKGEFFLNSYFINKQGSTLFTDRVVKDLNLI